MKQNKDTDLLTLIRTVDPNDREACDELNARFWCFLNNLSIVDMGSRLGNMDYYCATNNHDHVEEVPRVNYTHSLDALKAVQDAELEGWENCCSFGGTYSNMDMWRPDSLQPDHRYAVAVQSKDLPTMQLAWMDALYQAITWKKENETE